MPVGLSDQMPELFPIAGMRLSSVRAGIKKRAGHDLVLIELDEGCKTAAVFTKNDFCAAPVTLAKAHLVAHQPKLLMINSGNANTCARIGECCSLFRHKAAVFLGEHINAFST